MAESFSSVSDCYPWLSLPGRNAAEKVTMDPEVTLSIAMLSRRMYEESCEEFRFYPGIPIRSRFAVRKRQHSSVVVNYLVREDKCFIEIPYLRHASWKSPSF